jgi:lambda family phage minor tail protein L
MTQLNTTRWDGLVEFVSLDLTPWAGSILRYCNSKPLSDQGLDLPELGTVRWNNQDWQCYPFTTGGWQRSSENKAQPSIEVPDFMGALAVRLAEIGNAPGAEVIRYQALAEDVISGNEQAAIARYEYLLDSVTSGQLSVNLNLATHLDFGGVKVPSFKMYREHYPGLGSNLRASD